MAEEALRVLALGMVRGLQPHAELYPPALAEEFVILGLVGLIDPPRQEAAAAVATGAPEVVQAEEAVSQAPVVKTDWEKTPRNAPCPCCSGKKFKQCHGAA